MRAATHTLDDTLLALADPTRRAILDHLSRGEARVTDLAQPFSISLNSVSKHIRLLERADLIRRDVRGREHVLSFNAGPLDAAAEWIERHRALWRARLRAPTICCRKKIAPVAVGRARRERMAMTGSADDIVVRVTHRFAASAERVYDAFLDPARAGRFLFATATGHIVRCEIDARVGGSFTIVDRRAGEDVAHTGRYVALERPRLIVFTFSVAKVLERAQHGDDRDRAAAQGMRS